MIGTETVFILGAGASIPYGFPSGRKLKEMVCGDKSAVPNVLGISDEERQDYNNFKHDLIHSGSPSVDAFLEHRSDRLEIGKAAIAAVMLERELTAKIFSPDEIDDDWLQYLFTQMNCESLEAFAENKVSFITFNYDRVIEHYLFTALRNKFFGADDADVRRVLTRIPIVHLHGSLGEHYGFHGNGISFGINRPPQEFWKAANNIKIVTESVDDDPEFLEARSLISVADRIVIIGFGWNHTNVRRLGLDSMRKNCKPYCSFYGLEVQELDGLRAVFNKHAREFLIVIREARARERELTALKFIRKYVPLC